MRRIGGERIECQIITKRRNVQIGLRLGFRAAQTPFAGDFEERQMRIVRAVQKLLHQRGDKNRFATST